MDDLDHSMHIAEYDWTSFFDESEECGLLQPSLACPDHSSLSDSEDSGNSSPVSITGQQELQQSPDASSEKAESNTAGEQDDPKTKAEKDSDMGVNCEIGQDYPEGNTTNPEEVHARAAEHITEETYDDVTLQTERLNVQFSDREAAELKKDNRDVLTESDTCDLKAIQESDPLSCNQTELNVNEPRRADRAESEDVSSVALRAERERWFVTVNDSPARQRVRAPSGKKKRRQKKTRKDSHIFRTSIQEKTLDKGFKSEKNRDNNEAKGGGDTEENPDSILIGVISDLSQMSSTSGEEDILSEKLVMPHPPKEMFTLHDTFTTKGPSRFDSLESEDGAEFLSTHSYDSESYLSAAESMDEPQAPIVENQQLQSSLSVTTNSCLLSLTEITNAEHTQVREMHSGESPLSSNGTAANSEGYESTDVEPFLMFPSEGECVNKMPDEVSACVNDAHSTQPCTSSDTPGLQKHEVNLSASVCSSGDQPSLRPVPDVTVTPCSVTDSPETYAEAAGNTRPVYAISAFWDEMEKLTINDILQLRMGRTTPPRETQEAETPTVDDFPTNHSSLVETVEYSLSNSGSMDASDTADSDYFTQADESKPDRSSCDFSTSDFEEEYWQFLGASRNTSPDPQSKNHQETGGSPFFEEEESTCSEGKETPVPLEDFAGDCFEDQDSDAFSSSELAWPRQITKSKSMRNVQALNDTEDLSLQVLLGEDDSSLFLSSCPSLEENVALEEADSLGTLIPAPFLSSTVVLDEHSQISFPKMFEYLFKDQTKRDSCVTVYNPEDMSLAPVFDYTLCSFRDETSFSSLHDYPCNDEKPIPIFSCSHPTVRELTFPNPDYVFLSSDCKEDDISPIRVVSHAFILGSDYGASAAALRGFPSFLSIRKIHFHNKGSIWCGNSGAWVFPVECVKNAIKEADPPLSVLAERSVSTTPSQMFRELAVQQQILETLQTTRREGIFSTLKQSDMCLVCIAFASWVLRSSDPEAADTWKAALLANVSALSAIQYLRQYVKKKPPQGDP